MADPAPTSYDEMPYTNKAFAQSHPDRLASLARLFGIDPPMLETCRVLELGCAEGDNLIPMALAMPNARFVGIDLSRRQIERGRQVAETLGLTNIELRVHDIADVDTSFGMFNYIICHGIYSWVPAPIRERILAICRDRLVPNGVAYVSYNTLPRWRIRGMIRDMMVYHSSQFEAPTAKVQQARALVDFLAQSVPTTLPYGMTLRAELDVIRNAPDAYLFHDHLEEVNEPVYFHQFAEAAQRNGMQYLAEASFGDMLVSNFPAAVAETLRRIAPDIIRMEQYMDFMRNRTFRQTLLVHQGVAIRRNIDENSLRGLLVASPAQPVSAHPSLAQGASESFRTPNGAIITTPNAITKAALLLLAGQWPHGIGFDELAAAAGARLAAESGAAVGVRTTADDERLLGGQLLQGYGVGAIELRTWQPPLALAPSARPVASPLARLQAERAEIVTNLRNDQVVLSELLRRILPRLDGTRDVDALVAEMVKLAIDGNMEVREREGGPRITEKSALERIMRDAIERELSALARAGLLVA
jgi:methyltransferase-like protein/cyclopropane fatty-acyl-phospholipid synthase-like methyltransferase